MLNITDAAINSLSKKLESRNTPNARIRLGVRGGGCNGFSYVIQFYDGEPKEKDLEFTFGNIRVVVDNKSITYLNDCTLDWERSLMGEGFKFINPNEKSRCGCGKSFS
jgi:iron-sulfur cluster assembly protein